MVDFPSSDALLLISLIGLGIYLVITLYIIFKKGISRAFGFLLNEGAPIYFIGLFSGSIGFFGILMVFFYVGVGLSFFCVFAAGIYIIYKTSSYIRICKLIGRENTKVMTPGKTKDGENEDNENEDNENKDNENKDIENRDIKDKESENKDIEDKDNKRITTLQVKDYYQIFGKPIISIFLLFTCQVTLTCLYIVAIMNNEFQPKWETLGYFLLGYIAFASHYLLRYDEHSDTTRFWVLVVTANKEKITYNSEKSGEREKKFNYV